MLEFKPVHIGRLKRVIPRPVLVRITIDPVATSIAGAARHTEALLVPPFRGLHQFHNTYALTTENQVPSADEGLPTPMN